MNQEALGLEIERCYGYLALNWLLDFLLEISSSPVVLDMDSLLTSRHITIHELGRLCKFVGLDMEQDMLSWEQGPLPEWQVWADAGWHDAAEQCTEFQYTMDGTKVERERGGQLMGHKTFHRLLTQAHPIYWRLRTWIQRYPDSIAWS
jgi:hypothetical protein